MKWAALIAWVLTAGGGFVMLGIWLRNGGPGQQSQPGQRIRPPLIFSHFGLAAAGLVVWIIYVAADKDALAWVALAALVPVAALGFGMLALWLQRRQGRAATSAGTLDTTGTEPAEQRFPVPVVVLHGLLAVVTLVLVLLTAAGVGD
jgi:hypothetical protein